MDQYIHEQNLALYRKKLSETQDATQHRVLLGLIAEELAKEPLQKPEPRLGAKTWSQGVEKP